MRCAALSAPAPGSGRLHSLRSRSLAPPRRSPHWGWGSRGDDAGAGSRGLRRSRASCVRGVVGPRARLGSPPLAFARGASLRLAARPTSAAMRPRRRIGLRPVRHRRPGASGDGRSGRRGGRGATRRSGDIRPRRPRKLVQSDRVRVTRASAPPRAKRNATPSPTATCEASCTTAPASVVTML